MTSAMPLCWRANLPERGALLIAALSGRALAEAARASGYPPLVADFFGDADLVEVAAGSVVLPGDYGEGFQLAPLLKALHGLAQGRAIAGLVCGTGFEDRPALLDELARHWPLLGCGGEVVALVKHPLQFAALCAEAGVPHPETRLAAPDDTAGWLRKQWGGAGGAHVGRAATATATGIHYFQRHAAGTPVSLLVLAADRRAMVLGTTAQWTNPAPGQPFRYGGALRPAELDPAMQDKLAAAALRMAALAGRPGHGLCGLVSFDFLVTASGFTLLEINQRPGATLDVFSIPA